MLGKRAACPRFSPRLKIASFSSFISEYMFYTIYKPNELSAPMPKTRYFSDHEKRHAVNPLHIHDDINPIRLRTGSAYPSPLAQKAAPSTNRDFVRKQFSHVRQTDNVRQISNQ